MSGTSAWRLRKPALDGQIEGYADKVSALPGERVSLRVATDAHSFRVRAYRFGWYDGGLARLIWSSGIIAAKPQPEPVFSPKITRTVVAPWLPSVYLPTASWPPGAYLLKLTSGSGWQAHVPFFVRSAHAAGKVAIVAPVTTWQAYNDWGGYSLYTGGLLDRRAWAVSFDRPYAPPGARPMLSSIPAVVARAERLGVPLAYFTNVDVAVRPGLLTDALGYVSVGHDEYWTTGLRQRVLRARSAGTNLAFLGANTMYWRIRLIDGATGPNRVVVGYRSDAPLDPMYEDPMLTTARFRDEPAPKPESAVTGMLYECFPVDAPYRVVAPQWWGFRGTDVRRGTSFPRLVGGEADRVYPIPPTPRPLQILSFARYDCRGVETTTESVYFTAPSGAGVFTAGTLRWVCALGGSCGDKQFPPRTVRFVRQVTDNLLREYAHGPVGLRFPAADNVDRFDMPTVNQGTSAEDGGRRSWSAWLNPLINEQTRAAGIVFLVLLVAVLALHTRRRARTRSRLRHRGVRSAGPRDRSGD